MSNEVDSLAISIESDSKSAVNSLKTLENQLLSIGRALDGITASNGLKELSKVANEAAKSLAGIKINTKNITNGMNNNIDSQVKKATKSLEELQDKFKDLGKDFKFTGSCCRH